ncbi:MAG TPA: glycosyltransferase family 2 protein [Terrimicrobiaceae bacterium]
MILAILGCLFAVVPAALFARNLALYRPTPSGALTYVRCSVLIPARNEEANIAPAVRSILESTDTDIEVIVLDDDSTDRTAEIVREIAKADHRARIETAPPLPAGWCGKQHACHVLSRLASHPLLIFLDADVRLKRGAVARMAAFMEQSGAALASGVPEQETRSFSERLLVPLIHFVLLGFLPIGRMRTDGKPAFGAGCGQLFVALREAYEACGGHGAIRSTLHDGPKLPRVFRAAGFHTDLFDATDIAVCRMFSTGGDVWRGLARNAHEALGSPRLIVPATLVLFCGQVLPLIALASICRSAAPSRLALAFAFVGTGAAFLPRLVAVRRFRQSLEGALLHPFGICALLGIQWFAFFRSLLRRPAVWKDRKYFEAPAS